MSQRGRKSRPLGSIRRSMTATDVPKLPPLASPSQSIDRSIVGISGNAMSVPPPRASPERMTIEREEVTKPIKTPVTSGRQTSSSRSSGSKGDDGGQNDQLKKDLKDALTREKQLKMQIAALQKTIESLQGEITERMNINEALQEQLAKLQKLEEQESHYKDLYENEVKAHDETKKKISTYEDLLFAKDREISQLKLSQEETVKELNIKMEKKVLEVEKAKDAEIASRDEKLKRLKSQMADALRGNSWERQQQLDELSKELTRAQEESDMLRIKLKAMARNGAKPGNVGCANCDALSSRIQHLDRTINEKDKTIRDLKGIGDRFQQQLKQKEILGQLQNGK